MEMANRIYMQHKKCNANKTLVAKTRRHCRCVERQFESQSVQCPVQYLRGDLTVFLQMPQYMPPSECDWRDYCQEPTSVTELPFTQCPCPPRTLQWQSPSMESGTVNRQRLSHVFMFVLFSARVERLFAPLCAQDTSSEPQFTRTVPPTVSPRPLPWTLASDQRRRSQVSKHFQFTFLCSMQSSQKDDVIVSPSNILKLTLDVMSVFGHTNLIQD